MGEALWFVLALLGAWLGILAISGVAVLVQVLRLQLWPFHLDWQSPPAEYSADQLAAIDELKALGFRLVAEGTVEFGPRRFGTLVFRHAELPAFAHLTLQAGGQAGYPIAFHSFCADGTELVTFNRTGWLIMASPPEQRREDAWADNLDAHWQTHRARHAGTAVADISDEAALRRLSDNTEGYFPLLRERGLLTQEAGAWHPGLRAAAGVAWQWMKCWRRFASPYACAATSETHQAAFFASSYLHTEATLASRPPRHNLKATLLVLTALASLLAWSSTLSWQIGVVLVVILLVHEGGHALAMRAFGYRDMTMFFIPFIGAVVTGTPRALPAWKQAIVLLAGPLPGLLVGLALLLWAPPLPGLDWRLAATMAVMVNLFNLLPITPLDGGRLLELSLFSRWPRLRVAFAALSVLALAVLGLWSKSPVAWALVVAFGIGLAQQRRIAYLHRSWREGLPQEQQLLQLFEAARRKFGPQAFARQYALVKAVFTQRAVAVPRAWESALALAVLLAVWATTGVATYQWLPARAPQAPAQLSAEQQAFDTAFEEYRANDYEDDSDKYLPDLQQKATRLAPADPRRVDLQALLARRAEGEARQQAFLAILTARQEGNTETLESLQREMLRHLYDEHRDDSPRLRAAMLEAGIARASAAMPLKYAGTVDARLRWAEAIDQAGDPQRAEAMLADIRHRAENAEDCRCELKTVLSAQVWFFLSRNRTRDAITVLEASSARDSLRKPNGSLADDYAWALLSAGRIEEGLAQMRIAAYSEPWTPKLMQRLRGLKERPAELREPLDLAYALRRAGRAQEAAALMTARKHWVCEFVLREGKTFSHDQPWQQWRERNLVETAQAVCHRPDPAAGPSPA